MDRNSSHGVRGRNVALAVEGVCGPAQSSHKLSRCAAHKRNYRRLGLKFLDRSKSSYLSATALLMVSFYIPSFSNMFKVATANQYVVKTGFGVNDIKICKKCIVWPGQTAQ